MSKVAFIGLGAMGSRMVTHLIQAGHQVTVSDPDAQAVQEVTQAGAKAADSARKAAEGAEFVLAMVPNDDVSRKVWLEDESGALAGMDSNAVAIECSTLSPAWIRELAKAAEEAGTAMLEAPISGSTPQAESAQLVFLTGGDQKVVERAEPLLKAMGSTVKHAGPHGAGALAKLVTNTFMGTQLSLLAQAIAVLKSQGVEPQPVLDAVAATPLWSPHLTNDTKFMLHGTDEVHFPIKLLCKDLNYMVKAAGSGSSIPTIEEVRSLFQSALDQGMGDQDMTAIAKLFEGGQAKPA